MVSAVPGTPSTPAAPRYCRPTAAAAPSSWTPRAIGISSCAIFKTGSDTRLTPAGQDAPTLDAPSWFPSGDEVVFGDWFGHGEADRRAAHRRLWRSADARRRPFGPGHSGSPVSRVPRGRRGRQRLRYAALAADGSVGAAERVLKQSDPNIDGVRICRPTDRRWRIHFSRRTRRLNVFLTDFPGGTRQLQVTTSGGARPRFSGDGEALFYLARAAPGPILHGARWRRGRSRRSHCRRRPAGAALRGGEGAAGHFHDVVRRRARRTHVDHAADWRRKRARRRVVLVQNWRAAMRR